MRIIGNEQKNNGQIFWETLRIIGKILSIYNRRRPRLYTTDQINSYIYTYVYVPFAHIMETIYIIYNYVLT